jgi:hypothetical protein
MKSDVDDKECTHPVSVLRPGMCGKPAVVEITRRGDHVAWLCAEHLEEYMRNKPLDSGASMW